MALLAERGMKVEVTPDNVETHTVGDYGRINLGKSLAGKTVEIAILDVSDEEE